MSVKPANRLCYFVGWRAAPICVALILGACAGVVPGVAPDLQGVRSVGIIAAFGDTFHVQKVGITVVGNEFQEFPVAAWGIDDMAASKVRALLGRRFNIKPVNYQKSAFTTPNRSGIGAMVQQGVAPAGVVELIDQSLPNTLRQLQLIE